MHSFIVPARLMLLNIRGDNQAISGAQPSPATVDPLIPTIFHEPWWLDIATGGGYKTVEVSANGRVVGRLPYLVQKRLGITISFMPPLTHYLGPAVDDGEGTANTRFLKRLAITRELIAEMPKLAMTSISCHRQITDVISFQEQNFNSSVQFTYEIAPQPEEAIWQNMRDKTRNVIRRAQERISVRKLDDPAKFIAFYESNLAIRGKQNMNSRDTSIRLIEACLAKNCGTVFGAHNDKGELLAAIFCVWDKSSYFYLMSTRQMNSGNGVISLLIWEAIKDANARGLVFDFDGLSKKGGILFYTGFGGFTSPRYLVSRESKPLKAFHGLKNFIFGESFFSG